MITSEPAEQLWAIREFGSAELGNTLRRHRLIRLGARIAAAPAGRVTQVFADSAEREGCYRFLENEHVRAEAIVHAAVGAAATRAVGQPFVYVPVDGSSLSLRDPEGKRGLGSVGSRSNRGQGLKVMNAIVVGADGVPLGMGHQTWWRRGEKPTKRHREKRSIRRKETRHWLTAIEAVQTRWAEAGAVSRLWFQLDREGDFHELLDFAVHTSDWITVRSGQDRRVRDHKGRRLKRVLRDAPFLGSLQIDVPASKYRRARRATISVRARAVTLLLRNKQTGRRYEARLHAVLAHESRTTPHDEEPIEWLLLTNRCVTGFTAAKQVVHGYSARWKIEQFHRTWKSTCQVESTQLRSAEAIIRWATLLACVAMRIERLRDLARTSPTEPATVELAAHEIEALAWLRARKQPPTEAMPSIGEAVRWIAELGGYTGKSSGGPPGAATIGRGLQRLETAAIVVLNQRTHGPAKT